ncbi:two-component sensor histidine kinase [bacterium]|nr:two-component sensor histidine kinase [bacterium]
MINSTKNIVSEELSSAESVTEIPLGPRWEELYRDLASMAGELAHEIRNPLSTIQMSVQLLAEDLETPTKQADRRISQKIEVVARECQRLSSILDSFLRMTRLHQVEGRRVNLNELVAEVLEFSRPRITSSGIILRVDLQADLPAVCVDEDLWRQAILNLLLNAESASRPGDELMVRTRRDNDVVILDITDTGHGMTDEVRAQVFRPFFSTRQGGTGLGLPATKRIVEAHGGTIRVESQPSCGTAFRICLPVDC